MLINVSEISDKALLGIAQQYIETNISEVDVDFDFLEWTQKVIALVKSGKLLIEYSEVNESVYLVKAEEFNERNC